jgi:hypothetical protein
LFLDVYVPETAAPSSKLPVKVWIYGGSNAAGGIADPTYNGCYAAINTILVSINYRVGPLGWLALPEFGITGNFGTLRTLRLIQLNVRKQGVVHDSLMNDKEIQDATVLAIQEPKARIIHGRLLTTPMGHHKWIKMVPSTWREGRWAVRSFLWVNKDVEAEQVPIASPDMTAAILRLPDRRVLVVSVYVPKQDPHALRSTYSDLRKIITDTRRDAERQWTW